MKRYVGIFFSQHWHLNKMGHRGAKINIIFVEYQVNREWTINVPRITTHQLTASFSLVVSWIWLSWVCTISIYPILHSAASALKYPLKFCLALVDSKHKQFHQYSYTLKALILHSRCNLGSKSHWIRESLLAPATYTWSLTICHHT